MKVTLNRVNQDYLFEATNDNGHKVLLDNKSKEEGKVGGISPMDSFWQPLEVVVVSILWPFSTSKKSTLPISKWILKETGLLM